MDQTMKSRRVRFDWIRHYRNRVLVTGLSMVVVAASSLAVCEESASATSVTRAEVPLKLPTSTVMPVTGGHAIVRSLRNVASSNPRIAATFLPSWILMNTPYFQFSIGVGSMGRGTSRTKVRSTLLRNSSGLHYGDRSLTETFTEQPSGIEQSFRIGQRPPGNGDLVIDVPVSGLTAVESHGIVNLKDSTGSVRARYSGLRVHDSTGGQLGGHVPAMLSTIDHGHAIAITVDDAHVRYPLTIDPTWSSFLTSPVTTSGPADATTSDCPSVTSCTIGGYYYDGTYFRAFVVEGSGNSWSSPTPIADNLVPNYGSATDQVSCISAGNCVADGHYWVPLGSGETEDYFVATEVGGVWNPAIKVGANQGAIEGGVQIGGLKCFSDDDCTLVYGAEFSGYPSYGDYATIWNGASWSTPVSFGNFSDLQFPEGMSCTSDGNCTVIAYGGADSEVAGIWQPEATIAMPNGALWHAMISCAAPGECVATGWTRDSVGPQSVVLAESNGTWGTATAVSFAALGGVTSYPNSVSCATLTTCLIGGQYADGSGTQQAFALHTSGVSVGSPTELLGTVNVTGAAITSVICLSSNDCVLGGTYTTGSVSGVNQTQPALIQEVNGVYLPLPVDIAPIDSNQIGAISTLACLSNTNCVVGGTYDETYSGGIYPEAFAAQFSLTAIGPALGVAQSGPTKDLKPCQQTRFPVNCSSGDFWHTFTDSQVKGYGPGLELTRTYNSLNASSEGLFGYGWSSSYDMHLLANADGSVTIVEEDGSQVTAEPNGSGGFTLPTWADSTLSLSGGIYTYVRQGTRTFTFDSSGHLTSIADPSGAVTTLAYASGQLTSVTDSSGRALTLAYGTNGLVSSVTDPMGRVTHYAYDSSGDLTSVTDPLGNVTSFTYDASHLLLTMTFPNGQSGGPDAGTDVVNTYDASGRVLTQTDQMGNVTTFVYSGDNFSSGGGTTTITDPNGNVEVQNYLNGTLQTLTKGYGTSSAATWSYQYDPATLGTTSTTDPNGNTTTSTYDANGNVISSTNALGQTTTYSYNAFNEPTCQASPMAASACSSLTPPSAITAGTATITSPSSAPPAYVTYNEYDTNGNLIYSTSGDYSPTGTLTQQRTSYDLYNGQSVTMGTTTDSCTTPAPSAELPCATINPDGVLTQLTYDAHGDLTSKSTQVTTKVSSPGIISTFAGGPLGPVTATAQSQSASQLATATIGGVSYLYVADPENNVIHRIDLATDVETVVAGTYAVGYYGDGYPATQAQLSGPYGVAVDSAGDIAIADSSNNAVRFVPASSGTYFGQAMTGGDMYTIAGTGTQGFSGNGAVATSAELNQPQAVAFDGNSIVIADTYNNQVRFIPATSGTYFGQSMSANDIYAIAGNSTQGYTGDGGAAASAELNAPIGVTLDSSGNLVIADTFNNAVRFVPLTSGTYYGQSMSADDIYTIAGNGTGGYSGDGGAATSAELNWPAIVAFDSSGDLAIADYSNHVVRFVPVTTTSHFGQSMTAGDVYTVAGNGSAGNSGDGGTATSAELGTITGVAFDPSGNLLMADEQYDTVRAVASSSGTLAGQSASANDIYLVAGSGNNTTTQFVGAATDAQLNSPSIVRTDASGNVYIADAGNDAIRFIPVTSGTYFGQSMTAKNIYTIAGDNYPGYSGDGAAATSAQLSNPSGVAIDAHGDVAIADTDNQVVRFIPATSGIYFGQSMTASDIYTIAGDTTAGYSGNGALATAAELNFPGGVGFDSAGDLVIADSGNNVVRFVPVASGTYFGQSMTASDIYTIAGDTTAGYSGNGALATSAELNSPQSLSVDSAGDVLVADSSNNVVRFIPATSGTYFGQSMTASDIYTIAGNATAGYSGDGASATSAELSDVLDASFDSSGNVLITDSGNDVVRLVPATSGTFFGVPMTEGDIYTLAGAGWTDHHFSGDGSAPLTAEFGWLTSTAPDGAGGYYIVDNVDQRVRHVSVTDTSSISVATTYAYDANGELTSMTSPNGNVSGANAANFTTTYAYNADGQITSQTQGGGAGATVTPRTTSYTYDGDANQTSVTDARGYTTTTTFNADDEATLVTNPLGDAMLTCYDGVGNVTQTVPAVGVAANSLTSASCPTSFPSSYGNRLATDATSTTYDALGEKTVVSTPAPPGLSGFETTTYAYDSGGRLTSVTAPSTSTASGAPSDVTDYTYDAAGQLLTTTVGAGTTSASTTSNCYDPNGEKTATVMADGNVSSVTSCSTVSPYQTSSSYQTGYAYDSLGELVTQDAPATTAAPSGQITTYTYDPAGNQLTSTSPNAVTATRTYTPLNQLSSVTYSDGTHALNYSYDPNGNMTTMVDASGTTTNVYDPFNELTSSTDGSANTTSYSYDLDGDTTGITYPLGPGATWASTDTVTYTYDHADQLASVSDFNGHTSTITTSADGLPLSQTLGSSGDSIATSYAANDAPTSITLSNASSTLQQFSYSDALSGAIASETDLPSSSSSPANYTYNAQSQVTQHTPGTGAAKAYAFDASGNLTTLPTGASATYNAGSEVTSSTLSGSTTSYSYDAAGNRTGESVGGSSTVTATYNGANQLTSYDDSQANVDNVTYNGLGLRTKMTVTPSGGGTGTNSFVWNTTTSVPQLMQDSHVAYIYGTSGTPFEQVNLSTGAVTYLVSDALGSVRGVVNSSGGLTATTSYDAWGNPLTSGGLFAETNIGFAGGFLGSQGLYYFINRYYDPTAGQFISVDPMVIATGQPYSYTGGDPVNEIDPLGLHWGWNPASDVNQAWNDTGGKVVHYVATHTIGVCLNVGAGWGAYETASGCVALSGGHFTLVGTAGGGGSSPTASASIGLLISNASKPSEIRGPFAQAGASVDLGLSIGAEGSIGNGNCGETIWENQLTGGIGLDLPIPFEGHGGATYTWTWSP